MPYKDIESARKAKREWARKHRVEPGESRTQEGIEPEVEPKVEPEVEPLDPKDWADRRNYSEVYLQALDAQGGKLTEASRVAMKGSVQPWPDRIPGSYLAPMIEGESQGEESHLREWLEEPGQRKKLGKICIALKRHGHSDDVTLGAYGPIFTEIGDILDETQVLDAS